MSDVRFVELTCHCKVIETAHTPNLVVQLGFQLTELVFQNKLTKWS